MTAENSSYAGDVVLQTRDLCKSFSGFVAVNNVSLSVKRGSIHALIGPNGAGKSTFFNLLAKSTKPSSGQILFEGTDITLQGAALTAQQGMVRSFQISAIFPRMTVAQNVRVALQSNIDTAYKFWKPLSSLDHLQQPTFELLREVDLDSQAAQQAGSLPYGQRRALELATTLALNPKVLLLDEPTQGMGHEDIDRITQLIKRVAARRTVLMVEHNMNVVSTIADTITVLQRGAVIAEGPYCHVSADPAVIQAYMGGRHRKLEVAHE